jgi:uncharacterized protein YjbI with pentapeptide repeats
MFNLVVTPNAGHVSIFETVPIFHHPEKASMRHDITRTLITLLVAASTLLGMDQVATAKTISLRKQLRLAPRAELRPWILAEWIRETAHSDTLLCDSLVVSGALELKNSIPDTVQPVLKFAHVVFQNEVGFSDLVFKRRVIFQEVVFQGLAKFGSQFLKGAEFFRARFQDRVDFRSAKFLEGSLFREGTYFTHSNFGKMAHFSHVQFQGHASFSKSRFNKAMFLEAKFHRGVDFSEVQFWEEADFLNTKFGRGANFWNAKFLKANFWNAVFQGRAGFRESLFVGNADFLGSKFEGDAMFESSEFQNGVSFKNSVFDSLSQFSRARFMAGADFESARFSNITHFDGAEFHGPGRFRSATFEGRSSIQVSSFDGYADFAFTVFKDQVSFGGKFKSVLDLRESQFTSLLDMRKLAFPDTVEDASGIILDFAQVSSILVRWDQLGGRILFSGEDTNGTPVYQAADAADNRIVSKVYALLQRNFRSEGQYADEDACLYELRTIERGHAYRDGEWGKYLLHLVMWISCGYGVYASHTLICSEIIIILFAILFAHQGAIQLQESQIGSEPQDGDQPSGSNFDRFRDALLLSTQSFLRLGGRSMSPTRKPVRIGRLSLVWLNYRDLAITESVIGLALTILLIVTIGRDWIR